MKYYFALSVIASVLAVLFAVIMFYSVKRNRSVGVVQVVVFVVGALLITAANGLVASLLALNTDWQAFAWIAALIHFVILVTMGTLVIKDMLK